MAIKQVLNKLGNTEKSGIINMLIKPISMLISIVYTPLLLAFLGDEKYGLWATILSIINWINYFDVGIGNGLRNLLSKEIAEENYDEARKSVSTAYMILSMIALGVYFVLVLSVIFLNWNTIFSTTIEIRPTLTISFTFICLNFVLALSNILFHALQQSEKVSIRGCLVQVINLIVLFFLSQKISGSLVIISILFGSSTMIVYLFNTIRIFKTNKYLKPSTQYFDKQKIKQISNVGIKFFAIQIFCLMLFTVDNLIITHYFGAEILTPFSIANKVFNTAYTLFAAFMVPYWSRSAVAFAKNDYQWIRSSIIRTSLFLALFTVGYILLQIIFKPLTFFWLHRELEYQSGIVPTMCIFYILHSISTLETSFINGSGKIDTQLWVFAIIGTLNIPLSIYMGVYMNMGTVGVRLATTLLMTFAVIALGFDLYRIVNNLGCSQR